MFVFTFPNITLDTVFVLYIVMNCDSGWFGYFHLWCQETWVTKREMLQGWISWLMFHLVLFLSASILVGVCIWLSALLCCLPQKHDSVRVQGFCDGAGALCGSSGHCRPSARKLSLPPPHLHPGLLWDGKWAIAGDGVCFVTVRPDAIHAWAFQVL